MLLSVDPFVYYAMSGQQVALKLHVLQQWWPPNRKTPHKSAVFSTLEGVVCIK